MNRILRHTQKGFTLIELLIVIAILGALAVVVVPLVSNALNTANRTAANTEAANIETSALVYLADKNEFPINSSLLMPDYISSSPKASYVFDIISGRISNVTAHTWDNIIWDKSEHQWIKGDGISQE